jgi:hypothetical protein
MRIYYQSNTGNIYAASNDELYNESIASNWSDVASVISPGELTKPNNLIGKKIDLTTLELIDIA